MKHLAAHTVVALFIALLSRESFKNMRIYTSKRSKSVSDIFIPHVDSRVNNSLPVHQIKKSKDVCGQEVTCYVIMLLFPGFTLQA